MFKPTLKAIEPLLSGENALDIAAHIHDLDRWSSFDRHREASRYCCEKMKQYGLEAELFPIPADGESIFGDFVMPRAWDAKEGTLTLLGNDERGEVELCRYTHEPCSLVVHSKATPPGGTTAEIVLMDGGSKAEDYNNVDVAGKVIFTRLSPREVKVEAIKHEAVGIISDELPEYPMRPPMELPDTVAWVRFMSDHSGGGWGMRKGDSECWGFMLSPRQGHWLREIIAREGTVRVHAEVDAGLYDGTLEVVTGWIPGETDEHVIFNGYLHEYGAIDNASGAGLSIEILRTLRQLIDAGKLPQPKRGIRMIFSYECMGTMAAVVQRPDIFGENAVAGLTMDCVGGRESLNHAPLDIWSNPYAAGCYTDVLLAGIMQHLSDHDTVLVNWRRKPFGGADNIIADPTIGVPCPALIECPYTHYHASSDTPDKLDPKRLAWIGKAAATYAYFIANAGEAEAHWLAEQVFSEAQYAFVEQANEFVSALYADPKPRGPVKAANLWRRLSYQHARYGLAIDSVLRLVAKGKDSLARDLEAFKQELTKAAEAAFRHGAQIAGVPARKPPPSRSKYKQQAARLVPERLIIGPARETRIPLADREEWHAICERVGVTGNVAMYGEFWADGHRTIAEIEELVAGETGEAGCKLLDFFRGYEKYGYVKLHEA